MNPTVNRSYLLRLSIVLGAVVVTMLAWWMALQSDESDVSATSTPVVLRPATTTDAGTLTIAVAPPPPTSKPVVVPVTPPPVPVRPPVVVVPPVPETVGSTTLAMRAIPLLSGGEVHAGQTVPISYLQITNVGSAGTRLTGFRVLQTGTAPDRVVIGLSTVDDRGGSRGLVGGTEGATPFSGGAAIAPTDAYFAPHETRLFTIKAILSREVAAYRGMTLVLVVMSAETSAELHATFPIAGTTWTVQ